MKCAPIRLNHIQSFVVLLVVLTRTVVVANEAPTAVPISGIQGASHCSPFENRFITTRGIVTGVLRRGFFLQDPVGDGDPGTSDGIFVFTNATPGVIVGDEVQVEGQAVEFVPARARSTNLTCTEIESTAVTLLATNRPLPLAIILGTGGRSPPDAVIDDDRLASFDPETDGIDFYESLESMRVRVRNARSVSRTNRFGETFVVADHGANSTGENARGGITLVEGDVQPERVQIQESDELLDDPPPAVDVGTALGDIEGIVSYDFGNFEVLATDTYFASPGRLEREATDLVSTAEHFTVATLNAHNLDPHVESRARVSRDADVDDDLGDGTFATLAVQIVHNLKGPDIIALQEIQDNDGAEDSTVVDAGHTLDLLVAMVYGAGGPHYEHVDLPPVDDADGGQPGGNIRVAFLYNPGRVTLLGVTRLVDQDLSDGDVFAHSRKPLVAELDVEGVRVWMVNSHFTSKSRSTPLFGRIQPPEDPDSIQRACQARVVFNYARCLLGEDPSSRLIVLGDFNAHDYEPPLRILAGIDQFLLRNLMRSLPRTERYTTIFQGNAQALDHILVSASLAPGAELDIVHANSEFLLQATDHDSIVARLRLDPATTVPATLGRHLSADSVDRTYFQFSADASEDLRIDVTTDDWQQDHGGGVTVALLAPTPPFVALQAAGSLPKTLVYRARATGQHGVMVLGWPRHKGGFRGRILLTVRPSSDSHRSLGRKVDGGI